MSVDRFRTAEETYEEMVRRAQQTAPTRLAPPPGEQPDLGQIWRQFLNEKVVAPAGRALGQAWELTPDPIKQHYIQPAMHLLDTGMREVTRPIGGMTHYEWARIAALAERGDPGAQLLWQLGRAGNTGKNLFEEKMNYDPTARQRVAAGFGQGTYDPGFFDPVGRASVPETRDRIIAAYEAERRAHRERSAAGMNPLQSYESGLEPARAAWMAAYENDPLDEFIAEMATDPLSWTGSGAVQNLAARGTATGARAIGASARTARIAGNTVEKTMQVIDKTQALPITGPFLAARVAAQTPAGRWVTDKALAVSPKSNWAQERSRVMTAVENDMAAGDTNPISRLRTVSYETAKNAPDPAAVFPTWTMSEVYRTWTMAVADKNTPIMAAAEQDLIRRKLIKMVRGKPRLSTRLVFHANIDDVLQAQSFGDVDTETLHDLADAFAFAAYKNNPSKYNTNIANVYPTLKFYAVPQIAGDPNVRGSFKPKYGISIAGGANQSTLPHELAHWFQWQAAPGTQQTILNDLGQATLTPAGQEQIAEGIENFLMDVPLNQVTRPESNWALAQYRATVDASYLRGRRPGELQAPTRQEVLDAFNGITARASGGGGAAAAPPVAPAAPGPVGAQTATGAPVPAAAAAPRIPTPPVPAVPPTVPLPSGTGAGAAAAAAPAPAAAADRPFQTRWDNSKGRWVRLYLDTGEVDATIPQAVVDPSTRTMYQMTPGMKPPEEPGTPKIVVTNNAELNAYVNTHFQTGDAAMPLSHHNAPDSLAKDGMQQVWVSTSVNGGVVGTKAGDIAASGTTHDLVYLGVFSPPTGAVDETYHVYEVVPKSETGSDVPTSLLPEDTPYAAYNPAVLAQAADESDVQWVDGVGWEIDGVPLEPPAPKAVPPPAAPSPAITPHVLTQQEQNILASFSDVQPSTSNKTLSLHAHDWYEEIAPKYTGPGGLDADKIAADGYTHLESTYPLAAEDLDVGGIHTIQLDHVEDEVYTYKVVPYQGIPSTTPPASGALLPGTPEMDTYIKDVLLDASEPGDISALSLFQHANTVIFTASSPETLSDLFWFLSADIPGTEILHGPKHGVPTVQIVNKGTNPSSLGFDPAHTEIKSASDEAGIPFPPAPTNATPPGLYVSPNAAVQPTYQPGDHIPTKIYQLVHSDPNPLVITSMDDIASLKEFLDIPPHESIPLSALNSLGHMSIQLPAGGPSVSDVLNQFNTSEAYGGSTHLSYSNMAVGTPTINLGWLANPAAAAAPVAATVPTAPVASLYPYVFQPGYVGGMYPIPGAYAVFNANYSAEDLAKWVTHYGHPASTLEHPMVSVKTLLDVGHGVLESATPEMHQLLVDLLVSDAPGISVVYGTQFGKRVILFVADGFDLPASFAHEGTLPKSSLPPPPPMAPPASLVAYPPSPVYASVPPSAGAAAVPTIGQASPGTQVALSALPTYLTHAYPKVFTGTALYPDPNSTVHLPPSELDTWVQLYPGTGVVPEDPRISVAKVLDAGYGIIETDDHTALINLVDRLVIDDPNVSVTWGMWFDTYVAIIHGKGYDFASANGMLTSDGMKTLDAAGNELFVPPSPGTLPSPGAWNQDEVDSWTQTPSEAGLELDYYKLYSGPNAEKYVGEPDDYTGDPTYSVAKLMADGITKITFPGADGFDQLIALHGDLQDIPPGVKKISFTEHDPPLIEFVNDLDVDFEDVPALAPQTVMPEQVPWIHGATQQPVQAITLHTKDDVVKVSTLNGNEYTINVDAVAPSSGYGLVIIPTGLFIANDINTVAMSYLGDAGGKSYFKVGQMANATWLDDFDALEKYVQNLEQVATGATIAFYEDKIFKINTSDDLHTWMKPNPDIEDTFTIDEDGLYNAGYEAVAIPKELEIDVHGTAGAENKLYPVETGDATHDYFLVAAAEDPPIGNDMYSYLKSKGEGPTTALPTDIDPVLWMSGDQSFENLPIKYPSEDGLNASLEKMYAAGIRQIKVEEMKADQLSGMFDGAPGWGITDSDVTGGWVTFDIVAPHASLGTQPGTAEAAVMNALTGGASTPKNNFYITKTDDLLSYTNTAGKVSVTELLDDGWTGIEKGPGLMQAEVAGLLDYTGSGVTGKWTQLTPGDAETFFGSTPPPHLQASSTWMLEFEPVTTVLVLPNGTSIPKKNLVVNGWDQLAQYTQGFPPKVQVKLLLADGWTGIEVGPGMATAAIANPQAALPDLEYTDAGVFGMWQPQTPGGPAILEFEAFGVPSASTTSVPSAAANVVQPLLVTSPATVQVLGNQYPSGLTASPVSLEKIYQEGIRQLEVSTSANQALLGALHVPPGWRITVINQTDTATMYRILPPSPGSAAAAAAAVPAMEIKNFADANALLNADGKIDLAALLKEHPNLNVAQNVHDRWVKEGFFVDKRATVTTSPVTLANGTKGVRYVTVTPLASSTVAHLQTEADVNKLLRENQVQGFFDAVQVFNKYRKVYVEPEVYAYFRSKLPKMGNDLWASAEEDFDTMMDIHAWTKTPLISQAISEHGVTLRPVAYTRAGRPQKPFGISAEVDHEAATAQYRAHEDLSQQAVITLTPNEADALVKVHRGMTYNQIKQWQRDGIPIPGMSPEELAELDKNIASAYAKAPRLREAVTVFRGDRQEDFDKAIMDWYMETEGEPFIVDRPAFVSTSYQSGVSEGYARAKSGDGRALLFRIEVPAGIKAWAVNTLHVPSGLPTATGTTTGTRALGTMGEFEYSFAPGAKFVIEPSRANLRHRTQQNEVVLRMLDPESDEFRHATGDAVYQSNVPLVAKGYVTPPQVSSTPPLSAVTPQEAVDIVAGELRATPQQADAAGSMLQRLTSAVPAFHYDLLWSPQLPYRQHVERMIQATTNAERTAALRELGTSMNADFQTAGALLPGVLRWAASLLPSTTPNVGGTVGRSRFMSPLPDNQAELLNQVMSHPAVIAWKQKYDAAKIAVDALVVAKGFTLTDMTSVKDILAFEKTLAPDEKKIIKAWLDAGGFVDPATGRARQVYSSGIAQAWGEAVKKEYGVKDWVPPPAMAAIAKLMRGVKANWVAAAVATPANILNNAFDFGIKSVPDGINPMIGESAWTFAKKLGILPPTAVYDPRSIMRGTGMSLDEMRSSDSRLFVERIPIYGNWIRYHQMLSHTMESSARLSAWVHGLRQELDLGFDGFLGEASRQGNAALAESLAKVGPDVSADEVMRLAIQAGVAPNAVSRLRDLRLRNILEASKKGEALADKVHFNVLDERNIEAWLHMRSIVPFQLWSTRNLAFYTATMAQHPWMLRTWMNYKEMSDEERERGGLTSRFADKIPLGVRDPLLATLFGPNTIYFNPMMAMSITSQLRDIPEDQDATPIGKALQTANRFGISLFPWYQIPLQALQVFGPNDEPGNVGRLTGVINPALSLGASALAGRPTSLDIEAPIRAAVRGVQRGVPPISETRVGDIPVGGSRLIDYLVSKKLEDLSLETMGVPNHPDYVVAMADPTDPLYQQAYMQVQWEMLQQQGRGLFVSGMATLPDTEAAARYRAAQLRPALDALSPEDRRMANAALAKSGDLSTAYWSASSDPRILQINAGLARGRDISRTPYSRIQDIDNQRKFLEYARYRQWLEGLPDAVQERSPAAYVRANP